MSNYKIIERKLSHGAVWYDVIYRPHPMLRPQVMKTTTELDDAKKHINMLRGYETVSSKELDY